MQKKITWLHLSDIHFSKVDAWRDDNNRNSLLSYLRGMFACQPELKPDFIFCTGDIAFGEQASDPLAQQYASAKIFFDELLEVCGDSNGALPKDRLYFVPGNHDINRKKVNKDAQAYLNQGSDGGRSIAHIVNTRFDRKETEFTDAMRRLDEYVGFVEQYLPHQHDADGRAHYARVVEINGLRLGIAGFNSAWTCAGPEDDRNIWLAAEWQFNQAKKTLCEVDVRIGLVHHPVDWLSVPDRELSTARIASDFDFWLHGHSHSAWVTPVQSHTVIAAGAVGAGHSDEFGVNLTTVDLVSCSVTTHLHTRKSGASAWTIAPVAEHAVDGKWHFPLNARAAAKLHAKGLTMTRESDPPTDKPSDDGFIKRIFEKRLADSLRSFSTYSSSWVSRVISTVSEIERDADTAPTIDLTNLIQTPRSAFIKAPAQYGLTCLAHYIVLESWRSRDPKLVLYIDARDIQPNKASLDQFVADELQIIQHQLSDVAAIILDSWIADEKDASKILSLVCKKFPDVPLIVMQQIGSGSFSAGSVAVPDRTFEEYYLWALSRNVMRNIVASYNEARRIGDEDAVTSRLAADLDVLNLHRTPLNCITLLKVSEFDFDENPVNRSEMIKRVLFLLFNVDDIPHYKSRPDLKDCEYVLGRFCESLIRTNNYVFARDNFLLEVQKFCRESFIDLETHLVFDILFHNNIIVRIGNFFRFKFVYWIYYFAAQRMQHDEAFAAFIFENKRYARFPEIIEFYTGTDRRRNDALSILISDLRACHSQVREKSGLPDEMNPYKFALWLSDEGVKDQMRKEIADGVRDSNLPETIKDRYADRSYDVARPYNQSIQELFSEYSFLMMVRVMSAGARALRNSDYAEPEIKRQLLREIMICWDQTTRALFVVLPLLAQRGYAAYDGMGFALGAGFGTEDNERFMNILTCIPSNIMRWNRDDIYSRKMGPLLIDRIHQDDVGVLEKHELILLLIDTRPRDWEKIVQTYITDSAKDSFYLMDVYNALRVQYRMGYFPNSTTQNTVEFLIKMAAVKHVTGEKRPSEKSVKGLTLDETASPIRAGRTRPDVKDRSLVSGVFASLLKKID